MLINAANNIFGEYRALYPDDNQVARLPHSLLNYLLVLYKSNTFFSTFTTYNPVGLKTSAVI